MQWGAPHSTAARRGRATRATATAGRAPTSCATSRTAARRTRCSTTAPPITGTIAQSFDCGRDDYYNPAPAAGSYLATHWNTYDSAFMAALRRIAPACGGGELWVPAPPVATTAPSISGRPRRGAPLQTHDGSWLNPPDTYIRTWQRQTPSTAG